MPTARSGFVYAAVPQGISGVRVMCSAFFWPIEE